MPGCQRVLGLTGRLVCLLAVMREVAYADLAAHTILIFPPNTFTG